MKNIITSLFFALCAAPLFAQTDAITRYFDKYVDDESFTMVYITPKMFQLLAKLDIKDPDYQNLKSVLTDVRGLRILTTEKNAMAHYKEITKAFSPQDYELLMSVRSDGDNVQFYTKEAGGKIQELLMLVGSTDEFVMLSFIGNIDLDKLAKMADKIDVKGTEHLKDLEKNNTSNKKSN